MNRSKTEVKIGTVEISKNTACAKCNTTIIASPSSRTDAYTRKVGKNPVEKPFCSLSCAEDI